MFYTERKNISFFFVKTSSACLCLIVNKFATVEFFLSLRNSSLLVKKNLHPLKVGFCFLSLRNIRIQICWGRGHLPVGNPLRNGFLLGDRRRCRDRATTLIVLQIRQTLHRAGPRGYFRLQVSNKLITFLKH